MVFWKRKKRPEQNPTTEQSPALPEADQQVQAPQEVASAPGASENAVAGGQDSTASAVTSESAKEQQLAAQPRQSAQPARPEDKPKRGLFSGIRRALKKTSQALNTDIRDLWKSKGELVDEEFLKRLFALLVKTDMGAEMARTIRDRIGKQYRARKVEFEEILQVIGDELRQTLAQGGNDLNWATEGPTVIMVVGVNGSGKTTTIAKLAYMFTQQGKKVLLGAGDTFRAAAVEQLTIWAERIGCDIVTADRGADPGVVAYQATKKAREENYDMLILDTAGRLQTQSNLMQQLQKIRRVVGKNIEGAPHEVLLVLDATAGQNALSQARGFSDAAGCTGIVLAKIDGTAKGGVIVPIRQQFDLPVKFVGVGEQLDDLEPFNPDAFVRGLLNEEDREAA